MVHQNRGNWFSYPKCCIKNYSKHGGGYYFVNCVRDLFMKKSVFDFRMNPFLVATPFHLFVHLPCSLECKKTFDYTKKLLGIIKQKNNRLYKDIVRLNRAPVFYTDILGRGILFEGKIKSNKINYKNFYFDKSGLKEQSKYNKEGDILLLSSIFGALSQGDSLVLEDGVLSIKKGDSLIKSFENSKHLLWKIINFI